MLLTALWSSAILGCADSQPQSFPDNDAHAPHTALIVPSTTSSPQGVGNSQALRILDKHKIHELESFFSGYQQLPRSDFAGSWISGYDMYIDDGYGRALHIVVSHNAEFWTLGKGDFKVAGDFDKFVRRLQQKAAH